VAAPFTNGRILKPQSEGMAPEYQERIRARATPGVFKLMTQERAEALIVTDQPEVGTSSRLIIELVEKSRLPASPTRTATGNSDDWVDAWPSHSRGIVLVLEPSTREAVFGIIRIGAWSLPLKAS
jgi:hypothetical protein